jgi:sn-glycerol 3-phosphate transport system ATP-binding protein
MSVFDNMAYGLKIRGVPRSEIAARVAKAADILQLKPLLGRKPRQLSGGQRQRVAMGRAIVRDPQVFLFDEPLSNLDAKLRVQMRVEIKRLQQELRTTSIYVTHDQVEAMTLADRLIVMNGGVAEQVGPPIELYERPETVFVAGFIGSPAMNFLPTSAKEDGLEIGGVIFRPTQKVAAGRRVTLGIRPEHLELDAGQPSLHLEAELVEALGADTIVHGTLGGASLLARLPGTHRVALGDAVPLRAAPEHLHVFDAETGRRI